MQSASEASPETVEAEAPPTLQDAYETPLRLHVMVCTPVYGDTVKRGYSLSVAQSMAYFAQVPGDVEKWIDIAMVYSSNVVENRHMLVSRALEYNATHILWWDSDIQAPHDAIVKLVNHHQPIVGINYSKKEPEARPTAYVDSDKHVGPVYTQKHHTGLCAVDSCGFGLLLVDTQVYEKLEPPFFQLTQAGTRGIKTETEDVFFCRKAREAGYQVLIDHDLSKRCGHIGDWVYTTDMSDIAQAAKQQIYRGMPTSNPDVPL